MIARRHARRGSALVIVLAAAFLIVTLAAILARLTVHEHARQRAAMLETCAEQVVLSARDWTRRHADELTDGNPRSLPLESQLPQHISGEIELIALRSADGERIVRCELRLERAGQRLRRVMYWPLLAGPERPAQTP